MKGYTGVNCDTIIDNCKPDPCINGNCTSIVGSFTCLCPKGFAGTQCEVYVKQCSTNLCQNGGVCSDDGQGGYTCKSHEVIFVLKD